MASVSPVPDGTLLCKRMPDCFRVDLRLSKGFRFDRFAPLLSVYLDIVNVFDSDNVIDVYGSTGDPDDTGWLETQPGQQWLAENQDADWTGLNGEEKYHLRQNDPLNYDLPFQLRLGMRVNF